MRQAGTDIEGGLKNGGQVSDQGEEAKRTLVPSEPEPIIGRGVSQRF